MVLVLGGGGGRDFKKLICTKKKIKKKINKYCFDYLGIIPVKEFIIIAVVV